MNYNIVIAGDKQVGKTTYIKRLATGEFQKNYTPTDGTIITPLSFNSTVGKVTFHVYDGGYPATVHGAIIMCDLTNVDSFKHLIHHYHWIRSMFGLVPVILCGSKTDLKDRKVSSRRISQMIHDTHKSCNFIYFDISSKTNYNFEKPFLHLFRRLRNPNFDSTLLVDDKISFVEHEPVNPVECH